MSDDKPAKPEADFLSADDVEGLFAGDDRTTIDLYIPEWKKTVKLKQLSAADLHQLQDIPKNDGMILMVSLSVVDGNGNRLFKDPQRLNGRSVAVLDRIQDAALKLNGLYGKAMAAVAAAKNG
jgi:hypothetical protein